MIVTDEVLREAVSEYVEEVTPRERVHRVIERTCDAVSADAVAEYAETTGKTAPKHLAELNHEDFMIETSHPDRQTILYKRSPISLVIEEVGRINNSGSKSELIDRIEEIEDEIKRYREQTGADSRIVR